MFGRTMCRWLQVPSEARRVNAVPKCWCCRWLWNIWCCCWGLNWGQLQMHYALWPAKPSLQLKMAPSLSFTNQRTLQKWVRGMENRYGATVTIRNSQHLWTLVPNTHKLGPANSQSAMDGRSVHGELFLLLQY